MTLTKTKTAMKQKAEKQAPKKLRLAKETLRTLTPEELRSVAGGQSAGSRLC